VITVLVGSQVSGTIQHLYVDFNSRVKKGDLIAQIDPALFKARLAEAQANFKSAEAARDKAWIAVLDAKRQLERLQKQQKQKLVSESDVDSARFAYDEAVVEHKIKTAAADQAKAARDREKVNLEYTSIYAPIDGVVISRSVDVGQTVAASLQAPTLFTIAQDLTRMQIETEVDEAFIGMIAPDQPVRFTVFAYQKRQFTGQVAQVRLNPTIEAGVVKYNCIIYVDNSDLALKPGMTATVTIEVARSENVLKVPNAALRFVPDWPAQRLKKLSAGIQANEGVIWLPDGEEVKPLKVALGTTGEKETQISGEGVQEGLPIVVPASRKGGERKRRFGLSLF
jgi:HlyD family secretion protein